MVYTPITAALLITGLVGGVFVGFVGFAASFVTFVHLASRAGLNAAMFGSDTVTMAHLVPISVDLLAVTVTVILGVPGISAATRSYALRVLYGAVAVSLIANGAEHVMAASLDPAERPEWMWTVTLLVGAIGPASAALAFHSLHCVWVDLGEHAAQQKRDAAALADARAAQERADALAEQERRDREAERADREAERADREAERAAEPVKNRGGDVAALVAAALAAGTSLADIKGSTLAREAGVSAQRGRQVVRDLREAHMLAYVHQQAQAGMPLATIVAAELVDRFGGDERLAMSVLDAYATGSRPTDAPGTPPGTPTATADDPDPSHTREEV